MKKFRFYLSETLENLQQQEELLALDDLSDVVTECEKMCRFEGKLTPTFMSHFLQALYRVYKFQPIFGENYAFCLGVECDRDELYKILWKVIRKSNMISFIIERKVITMIENIQSIESSHGKDFIVRAVIDHNEAQMIRKWGIELTEKEALAELGLYEKKVPKSAFPTTAEIEARKIAEVEEVEEVEEVAAVKETKQTFKKKR